MLTSLYAYFLAGLALENFKPLIAWLETHPTLASLAIFAISTAESLALVGLLIPGTLVMSAIGALVGSGILPATPVFISAIVGAIVGDGISYMLGYHFHAHIRDIWPFKHYPALLSKGENYFYKYGGMSVFMGRFLGPMRPIIPVIAGMMNMLPSRFIFANITSAIGWATVYLLPGMLLGAVSVQLAPHTATRLLVMIIVVALGLWLAYWIVKEIYYLLATFLKRLFKNTWDHICQQPRLHWLKVCIQDPLSPQNDMPLKLSAVLLLLIGLFAALAYCVSHPETSLTYNSSILNFFRNLRHETIDRYMVDISFCGSIHVLIFMHLAVLLWLTFNKWWHAARCWLGTGVLVFAATKLISVLIHSPQPLGLHQDNLALSFPSLHIAMSITLLTTLSMLVTHQLQRLRWVLHTVISILIVAIILSHLYFGTVWITDVLGGVLLGLICTLLITLIYHRLLPDSISPAGLLIVASVAFFLSWSWQTYYHHQKRLIKYAISWPKYTMETEAWWTLQVQPQHVYRQNGFGHTIELFNVQWASKLDDIEQALTIRGWQALPKPNIAIILNRITAKPNEHQLPALPQLHQGRKPALVMTKMMKNPHRLLVLRLWNTNLTLDNGAIPLWLGTVTYQRESSLIPFISNNKTHSTKADTSLTAANDALKVDLVSFEWKQIFHTDASCFLYPEKIDCAGDILLIRPAKGKKSTHAY